MFSLQNGIGTILLKTMPQVRKEKLQIALASTKQMGNVFDPKEILSSHSQELNFMNSINFGL